MSPFLKTDLKGKVNNLPDFKQEALLPVFEAVINSIQALEEIGNPLDGKITVRIIREALPQDMFDTSKEEKKIFAFEIEDNGIGFTKENYDSFRTSDSTHKIEMGGKGVGRFFWLKAFEQVEIESIYENSDKRFLRKIAFCIKRGIRQIANQSTDQPRRTIVRLLKFKEEYRKLQSAFKTTKKISQRIIEHCLSYYITGRVINVTIEDGDESIHLPSLFKVIEEKISTALLRIEQEDFLVSHVRLYSTQFSLHNIVLCANHREVKRIDLSKLIGTSLQFDEEGEKFVYCAYVTGDYLNKYVTYGRTEFSIPDQLGGTFFYDEYTVSMEQIKKSVAEQAKAYLGKYLEVVENMKKDTVARYIEYYPSLRAVPHYSPEMYTEIEPNSSPEKIHEVLYKYKGKAELEIQNRGRELLKTQAESIEEIEDEYKNLTDQIEDYQKDSLAGYIIFRKLIIDLLDRKLQINKSAKYSNEGIIHDIIFPRKTRSDQLGFEEHNLWLLDEMLTFHDFAVSDKPLNEYTSSKSEERPDIVAFAEIDDDRIARTVSLIELKKPQRQKIDEDPTKQLYRYIREIRENTVKMHNGRTLNVSDNTRFYCYSVCDLTKPIEEYAENHHYLKLKGELGYYDYNGTLHTHMSIISFDKIVSDAKRRHRAFFEKLGIKE